MGKVKQTGQIKPFFLAYVMVSLDAASDMGLLAPEMLKFVETENDDALRLYMQPDTGGQGFECRSQKAFVKALEYFTEKART